MSEVVTENLENLPIEKLKEMVNQAEPQAEEPKPEPIPAPVEGITEAPKETPKEEPKLILGKFKTPEDVERGYQELEKKTTQEAQRRSKYRELLEPYVEFDAEGNIVGAKAPPPTITPLPKETTTPQTQEDVLGMLEGRYNALEQQYGPVKASLIIQAEMAQAITRKETESLVELRAEREVEKQKRILRKTKADFGTYEEDVDNYLAKMDNVSKQNPKAVETVYKLIKGDKFDDLVKQRENEINLKTAEIEKQKIGAQVEHQTKTPEEPSVDVTDTKITAKELAQRAGLGRVERY